jgi:hypothetical protein
MAAIGRKSAIYYRLRDLMFDTPAAFEADATIVRPVRMALKSRSLSIMRRESTIRLNSDSLFQTDSKTVFRGRILQFCRSTIAFPTTNEVLANIFARYEAMRKRTHFVSR